MPYGAAAFNQMITVQYTVKKPDKAGQVERSWVDFCMAWAAVIDIRSQERYFTIGQTQQLADYEFIVRYTPTTEQIDHTMQVVYRGAVYSIGSATSIAGKNQEIRIVATRSTNHKPPERREVS